MTRLFLFKQYELVFVSDTQISIWQIKIKWVKRSLERIIPHKMPNKDTESLLANMEMLVIPI